MMTDKTLSELRIGDYIADMHYGADQLRERFEVVMHLRWDEPTRADGKPHYVDHPFFDYLGQFTPNRMAGNKMLTVIGTMHPLLDRSVTAYTVIAAYCYDGRRSGLVVLREKPTESHEPGCGTYAGGSCSCSPYKEG